MRILALLFVVCSYQASGQVIISLLLGDKLNSGGVEFGLDGGLSLSNMRGAQQSDYLRAFNLGFYFDIKLKGPHLFLHTGVMVQSVLGAEGLPVYSLNDPALDAAFAGGSITRRLKYFNMPAAVKYRFSNNFFIEGGPMVSLLNKAYDEFYADVYSKDDLYFERGIVSYIHRLDFGVLAGVGYRLMKGYRMNLAIRYYQGFVDVVIDDSSPNQYNSGLYFAFGIPVGMGKKEKKAA